MLTLLFISPSLIKNSVQTSSNSGNEVNRTWTKAICNSGNYCQDYEISCHNNNLVGMTPTGNAIQFPANWKDPRDLDSINRLC